jgi:hypothetical protein
MRRAPYRQALPALELSLERYTDSVPSDGAWYLIRAGEQVGRFRTLNDAQVAWRETVRESGWEPPVRERDPDAVLRGERMERWSRNRAG